MEQPESSRISVVICTYRNPELLEGAIRSLLSQTLSADQYEIIVVDNNSQDQTPEVVQRLGAGDQPAVRYVLETQHGLSHARNRGVGTAGADIVAFMDDDAEANENWLAALLPAYDRSADIWAVGGKILPIWHTDERPAWWTDEYLGWLSLIDWGDEPRALAWPERILGTNCSFRKSVFREIGDFDPRLGRRAESLLGHEDTELQQRIHLSNKTVYYEPGAIVYHHVPAERLTEDYFLRRQLGASRSQMALVIKQKGYRAAFRELLMDGRRLGRIPFAVIPMMLTRRSQIPFEPKRLLYRYWGLIVGLAENLFASASR